VSELKELYRKTLVGQVRALDGFGAWSKLDDAQLLTMKYVKTKEDLKSVPLIADIDEGIIKDIRVLYQALALAFEAKTHQVATVVLEMSHEGFGRVVVVTDTQVLFTKYFKDAHRFSFRTLEKLEEEGEKMLLHALEIYQKELACV
jgi:probable nitrogen fixation protein